LTITSLAPVSTKRSYDTSESESEPETNLIDSELDAALAFLKRQKQN
jgi:hypothetical protein